MPTNHDVWDAVAQTDGTPANSFEMLIAKKNPTSGVYEVSADITAVNPAFTAKNRNRETYAAKGVDSMSKYGQTLVLTFNVEAIRDNSGLFQPWLQDLLDASKVNGAANRRTLRVYDALGADYAFQSVFAISVGRTNTGWDDASFFTITATQYGTTSWIANPVLAGAALPVVVDVSPSSIAAATAGSHIYIQGRGFTGTTGAASVKIAGVNATSYTVIDDNLIDAIIPAGVAGTAPVAVVSPVGAADVYTAFSRT